MTQATPGFCAGRPKIRRGVSRTSRHPLRGLRPGAAPGEPRSRGDGRWRPAAVRVLLDVQRGARAVRPPARGSGQQRGGFRHHERRHQPAAPHGPGPRRPQRRAPPRRRGRRAARSRRSRRRTAEEKVPLPDRWVRGLAETSHLLAGMEPVASLGGADARRFIGSLPRVALPGPDVHVLPMRGGWRTTTRPVVGSVPLPGASRLRGCDRILRFVEGVTVHRHRHGSTAWVFALGGARLTLALSPGPFRSFSGEGALLDLLVHPDAEVAGRRILDRLGWSPVIDPGRAVRRERPVAVRRTRGAGVAGGVRPARLRPRRGGVVPPGAAGRQRRGHASSPAAQRRPAVGRDRRSGGRRGSRELESPRHRG